MASGSVEDLSAREAYQLAAMMLTTGRLREVSGKEGDELLLAVLKLDRKETTETINCLLSLSDYQVLCPAGGYEKLGEYYLRYEAGQPDLIPYANLEQIGWNYEDSHLGIFVGDCFVVLPRQEPKQFYDGSNLDRLPDTDWSLRLNWTSPPCRRASGCACRTAPSTRRGGWTKSGWPCGNCRFRHFRSAAFWMCGAPFRNCPSVWTSIRIWQICLRWK